MAFATMVQIIQLSTTAVTQHKQTIATENDIYLGRNARHLLCCGSNVHRDADKAKITASQPQAHQWRERPC
jgi:hypothetical protein